MGLSALCAACNQVPDNSSVSQDATLSSTKVNESKLIPASPTRAEKTASKPINSHDTESGPTVENSLLADSIFTDDLKFDDPYHIQQSVLFEDESFEFDAPYWQHSMLADRVEYSVGRLSSQTIYGDKDGKDYLNNSFASASAIPLPGTGFGAHGSFQASPRLSFSASIHDAHGDTDWWNTDFIDQGAYFSALGLDYKPAWVDSGQDNYKVTLWRREIEESVDGSSGVALQYRKRYGEGISWSPFLRLNYQQRDTREIATLATAGLNIERLPGAEANSIGVAYAQRQEEQVAEPSHTFEMYYRMRLRPYLELTPDVQLTYQPIDHPALERIAATRLKLKLLF